MIHLETYEVEVLLLLGVIIVFGVPLKRTPIAPIYFHTTPTATTRIKP